MKLQRAELVVHLHSMITSPGISKQDRGFPLWSSLVSLDILFGKLGRIDWYILAILSLSTLRRLVIFIALPSVYGLAAILVSRRGLEIGCRKEKNTSKPSFPNLFVYFDDLLCRSQHRICAGGCLMSETETLIGPEGWSEEWRESPG